MTDKLPDSERARTVTDLDGLAYTLNTMAVALSKAGEEPIADVVQAAAEKLAAACWLLSKPAKTAD